MLAKAFAIFFIVVSASPFNAPFFTCDLGDFLTHRAPKRNLKETVQTLVAGDEAETSNSQQNLPARVRPFEGSQTHPQLRPSIVPGSHDIEARSAVRDAPHGFVQPLKLAPISQLLVLRV